MKIFVKTLNGIHFQIEVNPHHTVSDVKKNIESVQGANTYPASQQMLLYQGKVLTDGTTLEENRISENSFIVVMLCKSKIISGEGSVAATAKPTFKSKSLFGVTSVAAAAAKLTSKIKSSSKGSSVVVDATPTSKSKRSSEDSSVAAAPPKAPMPISKSKSSSEKSSVAASPMPLSKSKSSSGESSVAAAAASMTTSKTKSSSRKSPVAAAPMPTSKSKGSSVDTSVAAAAMPTSPTSKAPATLESSSVEEPTTPSTTVIDAPVSPVPASVPTSVTSPVDASSVSESYVSDQAASNLAAGHGLEDTIQDILDMGGGVWDRDTVIRALHAAFNNPERAVEYLYSGVPEQPEAGKPSNASTVSQQPTQVSQPATLPSSQPNAGPSNNFSQGLPTLGLNVALSGPLDFLRNSEQFQALRAMVQANPETLQPMLQELGKQNPNLMRLIQEHPADFQRLLNEPVEGEQGNILERFAAAMPQSIQVTPGEHAAIERLEAMGFDRSTVLEAYFACNKNEELTANFLLDHLHEFED